MQELPAKSISKLAFTLHCVITKEFPVNNYFLFIVNNYISNEKKRKNLFSFNFMRYIDEILLI